MIRVPVKIDAETRQAVRDRYFETIASIDHSHGDFVSRKLPQRVELLLRQPRAWQRKIGLYAQELHRMGVAPRRAHPTDNETDRAILAALFYLCDPYDVIPDHMLGTGFVDDALVINTCLSIIKKSSKSLYERVTDSVDGLSR